MTALNKNAEKLYQAQNFPKLPNAPPAIWGSDQLTKFWDGARHNRFGTVANIPVFCALSAIDGLFHRMSDGWPNPVDEIGAMLFLRSHSAFRAAAGQAADATRRCASLLGDWHEGFNSMATSFLTLAAN